MKARSQSDNEPALRLAPALRVKLSGVKTGLVEGYASTFNDMPDSYGDVVAPGAFARSIAEHKAEGTAPLMLWQHRSAEPIGRWTSMREDAKGLFVTGQVNLDTSRGKDVHAHLRDGDVSGLSIGFFVAEGGRKEQADGTSLLTELDLMEISVVSFPANRNARIAGTKNLASKTDLITLLREGGLSKAAAHRVAAGGWPALANEEHAKATALAERIARATAELRSI